MKNVLKKLSLFALLASLQLQAFAYDQTTMHCKEYHWKSGDIIPVEAQIFKTSSIKLPEEAFDVVWGAKELWETDYVKNMLFIKPLTTKSEGLSTTITVVGKTGNTYEFIVNRVTKLKAHCTAVTTDGALINQAKWDSLDGAKSAEVAALRNEIGQLRIQNMSVKSEALKEADRKSDEAIRMYQAAINSNYEWSKSSGWYAASGTVVDSVHDDGRFTYVKLRDDARGLMSASAEINGKKEILESTYMPETHTYKISGIFPKFLLRAGESELTINRKGA